MFLSKFQVNRVTNIEVLRQNLINHEKVMVICVSNDFQHMNCIKLPHAGSYEHAYFHTAVTIIYKVSISLQVLLFCLLKYVGYNYLVIPHILRSNLIGLILS